MKKDKAGARRASVERKTRETFVRLKLAIDGRGQSTCDIPDEFLRHMVETLAKYSGVDLEISAKGDIEHHLVEDVAITLGRGFREALGAGPVKRIASATVPMDEALAHVSVDLIDRPFVHLEIPDLMYEHFLRSFAMELRATVHTVVLRGKDRHHIVEATFKALGLALKDAMAPAERQMSTKSGVEWRTS
ncbi:MAG: imidazoleglycerol-phosphate dehydratase [Euryarchaeota archaeon RBG_16_62_10]|nr:MAG: imidazoleglycerol-phosphate dehydratase [Euryarchaeota archaeon RBG_16_62_10]